jgi:hypothetical protein
MMHDRRRGDTPPVRWMLVEGSERLSRDYSVMVVVSSYPGYSWGMEISS